MTNSAISQSELVRAMVDVGALLTSPLPLDERMPALCATAAYVLECDHLVVMLLDGDEYQATYQFGIPDEYADQFQQYRVQRGRPIVKKIEECKTFLLFSDTLNNGSIGRVAQLLGIHSAVIVPFTYPNGAALGYVTASYTADKTDVSIGEAELAMGMARIAQTTMLRYLETERRREVSQAMLEVADSERRRLSRDIHDDPLQRILGLRVGLESFRSRLAPGDERDEIDRFIEDCRGASASLREVMLRTHPNAAELADLEEVLQAMVDRHESGSGTKLKFIDNRSTDSPSYLVPALNRVSEQAARNTLRHAYASDLSVELSQRDQGTLLTISDNGRGFDPAVVDHTRLGLVSMRERTELLGGAFKVESAPGQGTKVSAWFPHKDVDD